MFKLTIGNIGEKYTESTISNFTDNIDSLSYKCKRDGYRMTKFIKMGQVRREDAYKANSIGEFDINQYYYPSNCHYEEFKEDFRKEIDKYFERNCLG